jgi:hypothetical protein
VVPDDMADDRPGLVVDAVKDDQIGHFGSHATD